VTRIGQLLALSLVVMGLAHTIARERIGEPLRRRAGDKTGWLGYFVACPYCLSHWIAMALVPITGTYAVDVAVEWGAATSVLRWFLSSILVAVLAAFLRVVFYFLDETQGLVRRRQRSVEEHVETQRAVREKVLHEGRLGDESAARSD
jgi:uncharacterized membrane protein